MIPQNLIINAAYDVGFDLVGVVRAEAMTAEHDRFCRWIAAGHHSTLTYLERNIDKRFDARLLVEGARSIVVCGVSYRSPLGDGYAEGWRTKVASYALARDYHITIKEMLAALATRLKEYAPDMTFRAFTDSAPLAEKSLAVRAGLGWIGRNSLLVNPDLGSMLHLGELVISEDVDAYSMPMTAVGCGECRRCIAACPNGAISEDRSINTHRCISCRTIEREATTTRDSVGEALVGSATRESGEGAGTCGATRESGGDAGICGATRESGVGVGICSATHESGEGVGICGAARESGVGVGICGATRESGVGAGICGATCESGGDACEMGAEPIKLDGWIYGCDACQSVCPYNRRAPMHRNKNFDPLFDPTTLDAAQWLAMSEAEFRAMAGSTTMPRAGLARIQRNISREE